MGLERRGSSDAVEAREIRSSLTPTEYVLRGGRSHLFLLAAGGGRLATADGEVALAAPRLNWIPHGEARRLRLEAGTRGAALSVPETMVRRAIPPGAIAGDVAETIGHPLIDRPLDPAALGRLAAHVEAVRRELFENGPASRTVIQYSLALLLIEIWRLFRPEALVPKTPPRKIAHDFLFLVDLHFTEHWTIRRYAEHLGVSKDRLTGAVRGATGRSPLDHVHARTVAEAKTLLTGSGLQVAEVAYRLGFKDAAYFNRFFQRRAGLPPGRYRERAARHDPGDGRSYAAWP